MLNNLIAYRFAYPNVTNFADHKATYLAMSAWIMEFIPDYPQGASCFKKGDCIYVNIRDDKLAMVFVLKFGKGSEYEPV